MGQPTDAAGDSAPRARVLLLTGPSGSGKTRLARASGLPVLNLDDFYKDGDDPTLPRQEHLGIVDWDDPATWDADAAVATLDRLARSGTADVPVYDISTSRRVGHRPFSVHGHPAFVAEGIFAAEVAAACAALGILADAVVVARRPWKNFLRRLARDLAERRKPPLTLVRRGWALMRGEAGVVARQVALGARACTAAETTALLAALARGSVGTITGP